VDFTIIWTEPAVNDLQAIISYTARKNPTAAISVANDVIQRIALLSTTPLMGRRFAKLPDRQIREVICGKYRIFYEVHEEEQRLEILAIQHSARGDPDLSLN
jgi:plasmid stabilization system protein ParE